MANCGHSLLACEGGESMLLMQMKFFEGELADIEKQFNKWAEDKYIKETTLMFRRSDVPVLKVSYGINKK